MSVVERLRRRVRVEVGGEVERLWETREWGDLVVTDILGEREGVEVGGEVERLGKRACELVGGSREVEEKSESGSW